MELLKGAFDFKLTKKGNLYYKTFNYQGKRLKLILGDGFIGLEGKSKNYYYLYYYYYKIEAGKLLYSKIFNDGKFKARYNYYYYKEISSGAKKEYYYYYLYYLKKDKLDYLIKKIKRVIDYFLKGKLKIENLGKRLKI